MEILQFINFKSKIKKYEERLKWWKQPDFLLAKLHKNKDETFMLISHQTLVFNSCLVVLVLEMRT
jgi:hypothetical protein